MIPIEYKTLAGLTKKADHVLKNKFSRINGQSSSMWINNALFVAETKFGDRESIEKIIQKHSISRPQDLAGGNSAFGIPLPTRDYIMGDTIPGVGRIDDLTEDQFYINNNWYHKRCFCEESKI